MRSDKEERQKHPHDGQSMQEKNHCSPPHKLSSAPLGNVAKFVPHVIKECILCSRDLSWIPFEVTRFPAGGLEQLDRLSKKPVEIRTGNLAVRRHDGGMVVRNRNRFLAM